jgi:hypothetical protein
MGQQDEDGTLSQTAHLLVEIALYGHRPFDNEPDPRPLPEPRQAAGAIADIFDAMVATLQDTRLEPDLEDLLWAFGNTFHRAAERIERQLDDNEVAQRRSVRDQDGTEVKSVELEKLLREGTTLIERRDAMEFFRETSADQFRLHLGRVWTPRSGSLVNRKTLTAAMVDSREFITARKRADNQVLIPAGTRIAITGGADYQNHRRIWDALDKVHAKHSDMVLMHGGSPTGVEHVAECWARSRKVATIAFRPDWNRHQKAAPFKRNDALLAELPVGVLAFPGTGINANLADKARKMGIRVWRFE